MTLSEFALQIRILGRLLAVVLVVLAIFYFMIVLLISSLKKSETKVVDINPIYGSLPFPSFEGALAPEQYRFTLDTIDGNYPNTTASANVYFIPEPKSTLAYLTKIDSLAQSFDFDTSIYKPQTLNEQWVKYEDESRILEANIKNYHFKYYYKSVPELQEIIEATPEAKFTLLEREFIETARMALSNRGAYPAHLAAGTTNTVYQRYDLSQKDFIAIKSGEFPQAVRIDFFRQDETLDILTPKYFDSQNYIILAPLNRYPQIVAAQYASFEKLASEPGTYPLITSKEAFKKLTQGEATTITVDPDATSRIKIKNIFLGYYDPESYQPYLQPVFVFLGDHNFVAYLPAIKAEYLTK